MKVPQQQTNKFALYHYDSCPFCKITRWSIDELGLDIELRNVQLQQKHRTDLLIGGGKTQVPCLRIDDENAGTQWLYESAEIINYLKSTQHQPISEALSA